MKSCLSAPSAVWNVAWVANALVTNPAGLYDANIFSPHRRALAFSEANIGAGTFAVPVWAATRNALAAHNSVVLLAFAASVAFTTVVLFQGHSSRLRGGLLLAGYGAVVVAFYLAGDRAV